MENQEVNDIFKNIEKYSIHQKNDIFKSLENKDFLEQIAILQEKVHFYEKLEQQAEGKRKELFQYYKNKTISAEEYTKQVRELLPYEVTESPVYSFKKTIRELQIQEDIKLVEQDNILTDISQLGENISDGGINNTGVFVLGEEFVARRSARGYDNASKLILYKDKITSPVIKKTLQVVKLNGDVYQVQERAFGKPILQLSKKEIDNISSQHMKAFWEAKDEMDALGLSIDISGGKSNVFYDQEQGFSIIDLGIGENIDNGRIQNILFTRNKISQLH